MLMAPITVLRDLVPLRSLSLVEALAVAERQAAAFHKLLALNAPPFPDSAIAELPRITVERVRPLPLAAASQALPGRWAILINAADAPTRQRFSLAHEFKHVLDDPFIQIPLYPAIGGMTMTQRAEQVCNFFAGCLLIPRAWLRRVWAMGLQDVRMLAAVFEVSVTAMKVRLEQVGLTRPDPYRLVAGVLA
jgi:hypothetical protein